MAASNLANNLVNEIHELDPEVTFVAGSSFYWSPTTKTVTFCDDDLRTTEGLWSLVHEAAHAVLGHRSYTTDFELLTLEVAAWQEARQLAKKVTLSIDENYIQDCLDTYRDWLHQRSTCPTCGTGGLQHDPKTYRCHNCLTIWHVSQSRFCRPYRKKARTGANKKSPDQIDQTTFN